MNGMAGNEKKGWKLQKQLRWLELLKMASTGLVWLEMAENCWKWLEWIEVAGNCWKLLEIAGNCWKQVEMAANGWNCWKYMYEDEEVSYHFFPFLSVSSINSNLFPFLAASSRFFKILLGVS